MNLDLNKMVPSYKDGILNIIKNRSVKALEGEILEIDSNRNVKNIIAFNDYNEELVKEKLENGVELYFPFVSGFDAYVLTVLGEGFDLDDGIEADWLEGIGYVPTGGRTIDIGELSISYKNLVGFTVRIINGEYQVKVAEYIKGSNNIKYIENAGLLGKDIEKFISLYRI